MRTQFILTPKKRRAYTPMTRLELMEYFFYTDGLVPRLIGTLHTKDTWRALDFTNHHEHAFGE